MSSAVVVVASSPRRPRARPLASPAPTLGLCDLPEDALLSLLRHLPLASLHALLRASPARVGPLLRATVRATPACELGSLRRTAAASALACGDLGLLRFALRLPHARSLPPDASHPLRLLYASPLAASASREGVLLLARALLAAGGRPRDLLQGAESLSDACILAVARLACGSGREPSLHPLSVRLARAGRSSAAQSLLREWRWLAEASAGACASAGVCGRYTLLHAAAEAGDVLLARALRLPHGRALLKQATCAGDNPASIALERGHLELFREFLAHGWGIAGMETAARERRVLEAALPAVAKQMRDVD